MPCCWPTRSTTRPRRCCSGSAAVPVLARSPGWCPVKGIFRRPFLAAASHQTPSRSAGPTACRGGTTRTTATRPSVECGMRREAAAAAGGRAGWRGGRGAGPYGRTGARGPGLTSTSWRGDAHTLDIAIVWRRLAPAMRSRVLRRTALDAGAPTRTSSLLTTSAELDRLITDWHGQLARSSFRAACRPAYELGDCPRATSTHACGRLSTWTNRTLTVTSNPTRSC